ncbi:diguanylate cyclase (GGDEF)-like protein [Paucimonas lemoignei]|uniref:Diguanylate cyclase (GGDEF)-like protein n=1 Tax=Paucimonas lemoignei TaxID=29443 RepID=A0A4R3HU24_PAULE|nr:CHASE domain-containing protein [Paucimonas lemoignei]TCS36528.1 diguanylate cyclase (GGDEF)-like protein [Paucimonas lemoignei]
MLAREAQRVADNYLREEFQFRSRDIADRIEKRLSLYQQVLKGTIGLFAVNGEVSRESFRTYINALGLLENYPGIEGIGFSVVVPPSQKDRHVQQVRRSGFPEYDIKPPGERDIYTSILYLEPFEGRNLHAFGFDMYSDERRRAAMAQARDSGQAVMSRKVTLVQEVESEVQPGFLMCLPVYRKGAPHDTVAERRENLVGWVYAPFRMRDLMRGIEGTRTRELDLEIYDGDKTGPENLLYDSNRGAEPVGHDPLFKHVSRLEIAGHQWLIEVSSLPLYETQQRVDRAGLILRGGISISLLLALLVWLFLDDRARTLQAADQAMRLALYDALTGLPNRKLLNERLTLALVKARREHGMVALLFIDLDKFKPVNDEYGHAIGDLLLKEVGVRLQHCMRASDTMARVGGDEFIALLEDIDGSEGAGKVAHKILHALTQPFDVSGHRLEIAASIGVAIYPENGEDQTTLTKSADMAMYDAKNSGRSTIRFAAKRGVA